MMFIGLEIAMLDVETVELDSVGDGDGCGGCGAACWGRVCVEPQSIFASLFVASQIGHVILAALFGVYRSPDSAQPSLCGSNYRIRKRSIVCRSV
jgi:hypothetical protein